MASMHVVISGKVQGVGFRWFARSAARRLDISGWVKNLDDGTVEVGAGGTPERLASFRADLEMGPEGAHVERITDLGSPDESDLDYPFGLRR
jgi:acylphosphatase